MKFKLSVNIDGLNEEELLPLIQMIYNQTGSLPIIGDMLVISDGTEYHIVDRIFQENDGVLEVDYVLT